MPFSVRCRYCRCVIVAVADQLGDREAAAIRAHLAGCTPNVGRWPHSIGELLQHLSVSIAAPRAAFDFEPLEIVPERARLATRRRDVLLVQHDEAVRTALIARLTGEGFSTADAVDAVDALRQLHAGIDPSAIVVDATMPRAAAWPFASWLSHHPLYARIPIIVVAAQPPPLSELAGSIAEFLKAPLDFATLLAILKRHSGRA